MVTKKGTPVKKTKDVKIAANVMADSIKTEEKAKAEVKTEIKPQTKEKVEAESKTEIKPQTKEKVEAKVEKAAADTVDKITKKAVAVVYILSTNVMAGIVPNIDLLNSNAPFGLTFVYMFNDTIANIVMAAMVISCFGALLCWQFTLSRVFKIFIDENPFSFYTITRCVLLEKVLLP